jgi:hypothetical protein
LAVGRSGKKKLWLPVELHPGCLASASVVVHDESSVFDA